MELKGSPPKPLNTTFDNNSYDKEGDGRYDGDDSTADVFKGNKLKVNTSATFDGSQSITVT